MFRINLLPTSLVNRQAVPVQSHAVYIEPLTIREFPAFQIKKSTLASGGIYLTIFIIECFFFYLN